MMARPTIAELNQQLEQLQTAHREALGAADEKQKELDAAKAAAKAAAEVAEKALAEYKEPEVGVLVVIDGVSNEKIPTQLKLKEAVTNANANVAALNTALEKLAERVNQANEAVERVQGELDQAQQEQRQEAEAARLVAEGEQARVLAEAARQAAEVEQARVLAEAARQAAEVEQARVLAEAEAARLAAEAQLAAEARNALIAQNATPEALYESLRQSFANSAGLVIPPAEDTVVANRLNEFDDRDSKEDVLQNLITYLNSLNKALRLPAASDEKTFNAVKTFCDNLHVKLRGPDDSWTPSNLAREVYDFRKLSDEQLTENAEMAFTLCYQMENLYPKPGAALPAADLVQRNAARGKYVADNARGEWTKKIASLFMYALALITVTVAVSAIVVATAPVSAPAGVIAAAAFMAQIQLEAMIVASFYVACEAINLAMNLYNKKKVIPEAKAEKLLTGSTAAIGAGLVAAPGVVAVVASVAGGAELGAVSINSAVANTSVVSATGGLASVGLMTATAGLAAAAGVMARRAFGLWRSSTETATVAKNVLDKTVENAAAPSRTRRQ